MARPCRHTEFTPGCSVCRWAQDCSPKGQAYRKTWGEPEPECPPDPSPPSLLQKVIGLGTAIANHITSGLPALPKEEQERRLALCQSCPKFNSEKGTCTLCGCIMSIKTRLAKASCPAKPPLWTPYVKP